jgi:hypothetical protein
VSERLLGDDLYWIEVLKLKADYIYSKSCNLYDLGIEGV